jgi:ElaB/YqjD/DUF883 family membrane-anchored ribosome-binding protein
MAGENTNTNDIQEQMEKQIAQLKREISRINRTLTERAEEAAEEASGWYDSASERASRATQALRTQAHAVRETVRDNPGTVSSAMLVGGAVGLLLGLAIGQSSSNRGRWY